MKHNIQKHLSRYQMCSPRPFMQISVTWSWPVPGVTRGCHGYTYMAGDTKLSPREMLAAGASWSVDTKSLCSPALTLSSPSYLAEFSRAGGPPPFRAPEVSSSKFCKAKQMFLHRPGGLWEECVSPRKTVHSLLQLILSFTGETDTTNTTR